MINNPIYKAQCFGNIEPIEYMVPYPNLRSLAVGQCIKFSENILFQDSGFTNGDFLKSINKYSNWLSEKGIVEGDRVFVQNIKSPIYEILTYAVWSLGAILVISDESDIDNIINIAKPKLIIDSISKINPDEIENQSDEYVTNSNVLLDDEAVLFFHKNKGIRLSHYNLLINTYGVLKELNILHKEIIKVDIPANTTIYLVLNNILPLYAGTTLSSDKADIVFGLTNESDFRIQFDCKNLTDTKPQSLFVLPEATAILTIGDKPNHLMSVNKKDNKFIVNGHSVMMGYLEYNQNEEVFKSGSLIISK